MPGATSDNTYIDRRAQILRGTQIWPGITILGNSAIGENCTLKDNAKVENSLVGSGSIVESSKIIDSFIGRGTRISESTIKNSRVGEMVTVGQYSVVEEDSVVGHEAQIGFCVILRRAVIGMKTKVPYLTELADIETGDDTNMAAGMKVSNFNGLDKKKTFVGNRCFIGTGVNLNGGVRTGNEVRIEPELFVASKKPIEDHTWLVKCTHGNHYFDPILNGSFKIPEHWKSV